MYKSCVFSAKPGRHRHTWVARTITARRWIRARIKKEIGRSHHPYALYLKALGNPYIAAESGDKGSRGTFSSLCASRGATLRVCKPCFGEGGSALYVRRNRIGGLLSISALRSSNFSPSRGGRQCFAHFSVRKPTHPTHCHNWFARRTSLQCEMCRAYCVNSSLRSCIV